MLGLFQQECKYCKKNFTSKLLAQKHMKYYHLNVKTPRSNCDLCNKSVFNPKEHAKIVHSMEKIYNCRECHHSCNDKGALKRHVQLVHDRMRKPYTGGSPITRFSCSAKF